MGNSCSKKKKSDKDKHRNCNCTLYPKYNHCCKQNCFNADTENAKAVLSSVLRKYHIENVTSIIIDYLPDPYNIIKIKTMTEYHCYTYQAIHYSMENNKPPCKVWIDSLTQSESNFHSEYPRIKVCLYSNIYLLYLPDTFFRVKDDDVRRCWCWKNGVNP